jgi:succinate dehydrogenase / fumarate reductase flavoprotein subunit
MLDAKIPAGELKDKWQNYKANAKLINPANRRNYKIIVIGTGLSGASSAASLAELGFQVEVFTFHDSARRAHSVAAQGGVNVAKDYKNDSDSVWRMFYDTLKGGDFRSREANVYRLAECSMSLIDQAVAEGVPFAREYSGYLSNRSFGGVQVSRKFYARGQTGQQLLLGAYQSLMRQSAGKNLKLNTRHEMLDIITLNGEAKGVVVRNMDTGSISTHHFDALIIASGGYGKIYYLSTLAMNCNATAIWRAHRNGAFMASPSWTQFHPTSLPQLGSYQSKLTLMSESLRNDCRIWVPKSADEKRSPNEIPDEDRDYYLERRYPAFGNLAPRDISSRAAKERIDKGFGVGPMKNAVYLDFKDAIERDGKKTIQERYGNLFEMYRKITGLNAYEEPMMIAPAAHFSMGGLWVDYRLMTNLKGLFSLGESNFSDHGANRLGANSLLQACVDGYFISPSTVMDYLAEIKPMEKDEIHAWEKAAKRTKEKVGQRIDRLLAIKGNTTAEEFHKELGQMLYANCGLARNQKDMEFALGSLYFIQERFYK